MKKTFKKALSLAMILMMVVSTMVILPMTVSAEEGEIAAVALTGAGTEADPWQISEAGNLVWMGQQSLLAGGYYVLTADIDMSGVTNFLGLQVQDFRLDGQNFAIKNLTVKDGNGTTATEWVGFIGYAFGEIVSVKNLKLENLQVNSVVADEVNNKYVGGVIGHCQTTTALIENVSLDSASKIYTNFYAATSKEAPDYTRVGGYIGIVAGVTSDVTIKDCVNNAEVYGEYHGENVSWAATRVGGFVGEYNGHASLKIVNGERGGVTKGKTVGGFIGIIDDAMAMLLEFDNCALKNGVTSNQAYQMAGYVARITSCPALEIVANNCVANTGESNLYSANSSTPAAGFFATVDKINSLTMTNCLNEVKFDTKGANSGFACEIKWANKVILTTCVNKSNITSIGWQGGGFFGYTSIAQNLTFTNCLNTGDVMANYTAGGFMGYTTGNAVIEASYCGNTGLIMNRTENVMTSQWGYYDVAIGGLIAVSYNNDAGPKAIFRYCYNTGKLVMSEDIDHQNPPEGEPVLRGVGGIVGEYCRRSGRNPLTFENCYVNCQAIYPSTYSYGAWYGASVKTGADQKVTITDCVTGMAADAGIAEINTVIDLAIHRANAAHEYDGVCDENCNICGDLNPNAHVYTDACDAECNECHATRIPPHVVDNACDVDCNVCGTERIPPHDYSGECDATCNTPGCGTTRTVTASHVSGPCDTACSVCGVAVTPTHVSSGACDEACNDCGAPLVALTGHTVPYCKTACTVCFATVAPVHTSSGACDTECNNCGEPLVPSAVHTYASACATKCSICGAARDKVPHVVGPCDSKCTVCRATVTPTHVSDGACDTKCNECGAKITATVGHSYDNACDVECDVCGTERDALTDHVYDADCDADCYLCGAKREVTVDHVYDDDEDLFCNVCKAKRVAPEKEPATTTPATTTPAPADDDAEEEKKGCGGAIHSTYALLAIVGILGFAFIAKKREEN